MSQEEKSANEAFDALLNFAIDTKNIKLLNAITISQTIIRAAEQTAYELRAARCN